MSTFEKLPSVVELQDYYNSNITKTHLKELLADPARNAGLRTDFAEGGVVMDCTHEKIDLNALNSLKAVAADAKIFDKID